MTTAIALAGGSWTFAAFILFMLVAFTYATYTRGGQGIDFHPYSRSNTDAPGANRPSAVSGREGIAAMTSRGTR